MGVRLVSLGNVGSMSGLPESGHGWAIYEHTTSARFGAAIGAGLDLRVEEVWSEWQDLNLRPPRPERGGLNLSC
jgi:hypothetical protein